MRRAWFRPGNLGIVLLAIAVIGGIGYWYWMGKTKLPVLSRAANFQLTNVHSGKQETLVDLGERVKLVEFLYVNCPDICPATTYNMAIIQDQLKQKKKFGKDVVFATITFDPERDTADVLKDYAAKMKVDTAGWNFYRGTEEETQKVLKDYKLYTEKVEGGYITHPVRSLFLVDRNNNVRKVYRMGADMNNEEIIKDILALSKE